jgi:predicted transcriptional regulator
LLVPADLLRALERLAAASERSLARIAIDALEQYVDVSDGPTEEIDRGIEDAVDGDFSLDEAEW